MTARACPDGATLNVRGEHFPCDAMDRMHPSSDTHDGWPHTSRAAQAVWGPFAGDPATARSGGVS